MENKQQVVVIEKWTSGDFIYGAVRDYQAPAGTPCLWLGRSEYPVAQLGYLDPEAGTYCVVRWLKHGEQVPLPIEGYNDPVHFGVKQHPAYKPWVNKSEKA